MNATIVHPHAASEYVSNCAEGHPPAGRLYCYRGVRQVELDQFNQGMTPEEWKGYKVVGWIDRFSSAAMYAREQGAQFWDPDGKLTPRARVIFVANPAALELIDGDGYHYKQTTFEDIEAVLGLNGEVLWRKGDTLPVNVSSL